MRNAILATLCLALAACAGSDNAAIPGPNPGPPDLVIVSGDGQSGPVGTELPDPFVVQATDDKDKPLKGQLVNFVVVAGGSMFAGSSLTNNDGQAQDFLILGPAAGQNLVEVRAVDPATGEKLVFAQFSATGIAPSPITRFTDEAAFLTASGAVATVTYPTPRANTVVTYTEGGVSLVSAGGFINRIGDETPILAGNEFLVSGAENVDIDLSPSVWAFGLRMQDGFAVGNVGTCPPFPTFDSQFEFTFKSGGTVLGTLTEDPPVDQLFFLGAIFNQPVDRIEIRELGSVIGDLGDKYCENDFFGVMFVAQ
jgi:hypothetical protein